MTLEEFKLEFKKHHICGIPVVPYELAYDSHCPQCEPDGLWAGWESECEKFYNKGRTIYRNGYWYSKEQLEKTGG